MTDHDAVVDTITVGETSKGMPFTKRRLSNGNAAVRSHVLLVMQTDGMLRKTFSGECDLAKTKPRQDNMHTHDYEEPESRKLDQSNTKRLRCGGVLEANCIGDEDKINPEDDDGTPSSEAVSELKRVVESVTNCRMGKDAHDKEDDEQEDGEDRNDRGMDDGASLEVDDDEDSQENEPHCSGNRASSMHTAMFVNFG